MQYNFFKLTGIALIITGSAVLFSSCKKDDPQPDPNEEEVITTLQLVFVPQGGGPMLTYKYDDPDGPGGANPTKDLIQLDASKTYDVAVQLLNKTVTPVEDITTEVQEEADAHRFYYEASGSSNIAVSNLSNDPDGIPVGISSRWTTGTAALGTIKVTLRHYPGTPPNKAIDDPVNSTKSSTDIEVEFNTEIN